MSLQPENICQMLLPGRQTFKYMSTVIIVNLKSKVLEIQGLKRLSSGNSIDHERMVSKADTYSVLLAIEKLGSNTDSDVFFLKFLLGVFGNGSQEFRRPNCAGTSRERTISSQN